MALNPLTRNTVKINFGKFCFVGMWRLEPAVVSRVLLGDDNGQEDPVPHRDVHALDSYRPHTQHKGIIFTVVFKSNKIKTHSVPTHF